MEREDENCACDNFNCAKASTVTEVLSINALIKNTNTKNTTNKKTLITQHVQFHPIWWYLLWDAEFTSLFKQHISQTMEFQRSTNTA